MGVHDVNHPRFIALSSIDPSESDGILPWGEEGVRGVVDTGKMIVDAQVQQAAT